MTLLEVKNLVVQYGNVPAVNNVSFSLDAGKSLTLLGPSGCGKTTLLRSIAGLEKPSQGSICLYGNKISDAASRIWVPTERRNLSMMFQSYAIWPHMTVFDNVAYGLRLRKVPAADVRRKVLDALALVGLADFADRPSPNLSGGQQQRVALARSFVFDPQLILFDEALSNLDARLRTQMRSELKALQTKLGIAAIFVTHDQEEALVMSDHVLVMRSGKVEQAGTPMDVYFHPETAFVADFIGGSNVIPVKATKVPASGLVKFSLGPGELVAEATGALETTNSLAVKTAHIQLSNERLDGPNSFQAVIENRRFVGDLVAYDLRWGDVRFSAHQLSVNMFDCNIQVWCSIEPRHVVPLSIEKGA